MIRRCFWFVVVVVVAAFVASFRGIATFVTDIMWFRELGYPQALWVPILSRVMVGFVAAAAFFVFSYANLRVAAKSFERVSLLSYNVPVRLTAEKARLVVFAVSLLLAAFAGLEGSSYWMVVQQFLHRAPGGARDPLFGLDVGFYMFSLPFYRLAYSFLMTLALVTTALVTAIYIVTRSIGLRGTHVTGTLRARHHVAGLATLCLLLKAWGYRLAGLALVYSSRGVAFGAGYTDVHATLPALKVLSVTAVVAAASLLASLFIRGEKLVLAAAGMLVVGSFVLGTIYPAIIQELSVEPNELSRERPYIGYNIGATRQAFGLNDIEVRPIDVRNDLTLERLVTAHRDTIKNMRLWDWRPLSQTLNQLQEIRVYYNFNDVDIDRYTVDGRTRQMALCARELSLAELPEQGRTWVNEHLVYTHGYGLVMSDVTRVSAEGLPSFTIRDIPLRSDEGFDVVRPEIYYGECTDEYVVVGTSAREFDYPAGESGTYTTYEGRGGVRLSSFWRRLLFAARFGSMQFLMSTDMSKDSRVLYIRNIRDRVKTIAPFLRYDKDPYLVLADGRLFWMWDAYVVSDLYPYSQPVEEGINYIRNSVKVVVDGYSGDVTFYTPDPDEPIIRSLAGVFPGMFAPMDEMPASLKAHVRYPEDLFAIQARVLGTYHTTDPDAFYKQEDFWEFPVEVYGGERQTVQPYYVFMRMPGDERPEYLLTVPFTPSGKDNMIAWLAARNDFPRYGQLMLYTFPKDRLVYGPMQVEARIDQDPAVSQALTLWSQRGSKVVRGNLLVIPIENSILYVEPLYLLAERSDLPELKRVIVSFGDAVAMDVTLEGALAAAFGAAAASDGAATEPEKGVQVLPQTSSQESATRALSELVGRAVRAYEDANKRLREGDFAGFGESLEELGTLLRELERGAK
ncbi:MAG: UPF0182 family protein [Betaproteobacteria bacterium]